MREKEKRGISLFIVGRFIIFFLLIAFVVTCSFLLFLNSIQLEESVIRENAALTFLNILFLTFLFCTIDAVRRRVTVEEPIKRILKATDRITKGDFNVTIEPKYNLASSHEFDDITEAINKMAKELAGVETLRSDFISNVSHELKTPLAVIQNYGTLLAVPSLSEEKRMEYANSITESSQKLASMITNILKLNKLENQQIYPDKKKYNLSEQLCTCMLNFESRWEEKSLLVDCDIEEEVFVDSDSELLEIIWNNLISNAVKFTEKGGKISLSLFQKNENIVVLVEDSGCGMDDSTGRHIFEKFYQGDTSHAMQGNGLGLALVKRIIDIVGGEITVESELGHGSRFCVKLRAVTLKSK